MIQGLAHNTGIPIFIESWDATQILCIENLELFKENKQLKLDLESTQKLLEDTQKGAKDQAERDAKSIRLLQDNLEARLVETKAVNNDLVSKLKSCLSIFNSRANASLLIRILSLGQIVAYAPSNENRRSLIGELGELILNFSTAGRCFVMSYSPTRMRRRFLWRKFPA